MNRFCRRPELRPHIQGAYSVLSLWFLAPTAFLFFLVPACAAQSQPQPVQYASPQQALVGALSAACRQNVPEFSNFLLAGSRRAFLALPEAEQKDFLKRFSMTSMPGHARPLLDAQKRMVVQCNTPAETVIFGLNAAQVDGNVAFIPVAVNGGETTDIGLVRQPEGWRLFSLDLLVINVPALVEQWQDAELRANEQTAAAELISIAQAIKSYHSAFGQWPDSLEQLGPAPPNDVSPEHAQLLPEEAASGTAGGYRFRYRVVTDSHGQIQGFELGAVPEQYGKTGRRSFFLDEDGDLHAADKQGAPATDSDPVIPPPSRPSS